MPQVLSGVRVIEVAQWWFVPAAGAVLADRGADVVEVEHPVAGDPMRALSGRHMSPTGPRIPLRLFTSCDGARRETWNVSQSTTA